MATGRQFSTYLQHHGMPDRVQGVAAEHIRRFLSAVLNGCWTEDDETIPCGCGTKPSSPGNVDKHYRNLKAYFNWLIKEDERKPPHPMVNVDRPKVPDKPTDVLSEAQLRALLKEASGTSMPDRRDTAIMRLLMDTGLRVSSLTDLRYSSDPDHSDVLLAQKLLRIRKKGGDIILVPIGKKAARDLDRYLRARAHHPEADSEWLWLGKQGRLQKSGIQQMLRRRGVRAGVGPIHAHQFRHTFADDWLEAGGTESDLMVIAGWSSPQMLRRYGRVAAGRRAQAAHARLSPGDRI
jgi:site-specific recombinase XerD